MMSVADESATRAIGIAGSSSEPAVFESAGSAGGSVSEIVRPKDVVVEEEQEAEPAKPYYWEEGGDPDMDWWGKVRHVFFFGGIKAIAGAEAVGEVVADTLGLNDSKYQYVIDALEADEIRRKTQEKDEEDRRQMELEEEAARTNSAQEGMADEEVGQSAGAVELELRSGKVPLSTGASVTDGPSASTVAEASPFQA